MKKFKLIFLIMLASIPVFINDDLSALGQARNLNVEVNPTSLESGFNTTITVNIINNFEAIYDIDISMNFPQSQITLTSPVIIGINNWRFERMKKGESTSIEALIFVPKAAAGSGYIANILISYKRLGYISPYTEAHNIGFYAKGEIDMVAYDFSIEEESIIAGSPLSITASLLNKGTVIARFTNISIAPNPILILQPESYSYLGDVDPNSPSPFTLEATIKTETKEGTYSIKIVTEYEDEERKSHRIENEIEVNVTVQSTEQKPQSIYDRAIEFIKANILYSLIAIIVIIVLIIIIIRRRSSKSEFEAGGFQQ